MGFDIYGLNPINETNVEKPIFPRDFNKLSDDEKNGYWDSRDAYEEAVPGDYWRSNVWWWRTLWAYTCEVCADVMTVTHMDAGSFNNGDKIPKTTAKRMVIKLKNAEAKGYHKKYEETHQEWMEKLPKDECNQCHTTGFRTDKIGRDARRKDPHYTCNGCDGKGYTKNFMASYPFSSEIAVSFRKFIQQSGGFQIC
tara:strand:- start:22417 stop:23004 length:588 start_codon:yes stop_codon:yes gene_type:complete